jgi:FlgD Ig-like domain
MHPARHRFISLRATSLACGLLLISLAGNALAQLPAPTCAITGPLTVSPGEPFELCGAAGEGYTYSWYDPNLVLLNHDRCLNFPNGITTPGEFDYEFVISQGEAFLKCPVHITVRELPPPPPQGACWLTGGGGKVEDASGTLVHSYGGNINPGCSPTAGQGGNWNDVWHTANLHFQGTAIQVITCGNVAGIPPGSTSPRTPFNFIDFRGTGTLKGIKGNKADYGQVFFFGHYEDRSEPGSQGQPNLDARDRYFLRVYTNQGDPLGSTVMLVDVDGNSATVDPVTVTHGNLQIHVTSCDAPLPPPSIAALDMSDDAGVTVPSELSFARPLPNPALNRTVLRFGLPRESNVSLKIFDVAGRQVRDLAAGMTAAGEHAVAWDLRDVAGQKVSRGLYFARLVVNGEARSQTVAVTN